MSRLKLSHRVEDGKCRTDPESLHEEVAQELKVAYLKKYPNPDETGSIWTDTTDPLRLRVWLPRGRALVQIRAELDDPSTRGNLSTWRIVGVGRSMDGCAAGASLLDTVDFTRTHGIYWSCSSPHGVPYRQPDVPLTDYAAARSEAEPIGDPGARDAAFREYLCDVMCFRLDHAAWDLFNTLARLIGLYPNTGDSP